MADPFQARSPAADRLLKRPGQDQATPQLGSLFPRQSVPMSPREAGGAGDLGTEGLTPKLPQEPLPPPLPPVPDPRLRRRQPSDEQQVASALELLLLSRQGGGA